MIRLDRCIYHHRWKIAPRKTPLDIVHISFLFYVLQIGIGASIDDEASRHMFESTMHAILVDNSVIRAAFRNLSHISGPCASIIKTSYHEDHRPQNLLLSSCYFTGLLHPLCLRRWKVHPFRGKNPIVKQQIFDLNSALADIATKIAFSVAININMGPPTLNSI